MAFTDLLEGIAEEFGQWDERGRQEQTLYNYTVAARAHDKIRKASPAYKAQRRAYMREYSKLAYVQERQRDYSREYQARPDVAALRRELYGEKKRLREQRRRKDPVVGERIREADRERYRRKVAAKGK